MTNEPIDLLIDATLVLSIALGGVLLLRRIWLRAFGARNALLLWAVVPVALIAILLPAPVVTIDPAAEPDVGVPSAQATPILPAARQQIGRAFPALADREAGLTTAAPPAPAGPSLQALVAVAWLMGALLAAAVLSVRQRRLLRSLGRLTRRRDGTFLSEQPGIGPMLVGALRPRIVLPADFEQRYSERQQSLIIAHERCHLRRGDAQFTLLACVLRCLFWFHPLVHLAWPRFRVDQELACDAAVLRAHPGRRREYAEAMLVTRSGSPMLPVGCTWLDGHPLKTRIRMVCAQPVGALRLITGTASVVLAGTALAVGTWSQQDPQRYYRAASLPELAMEVSPVEPTVPTPGRDRIAAPRIAPMPHYALSMLPPPTEPHPGPSPEPASPAEPIAAESPTATVAVEPALDAPVPARDAPTGAEVRASSGARVADADRVESGAEEAGTVPVEHARLIETTPPEFPQSMYRPRLLSYPGMPEEALPEEDWSPVGRLWGLLLRVRLDESGIPVAIDIDDSNLDDPRLVNRYHELAAAAVRDWRFAPARIDGRAVASEVLLPFYFDTHRYAIRPISYEAIATPRFRPGPPSVGAVSRYVNR